MDLSVKPDRHVDDAIIMDLSSRGITVTRMPGGPFDAHLQESTGACVDNVEITEQCLNLAPDRFNDTDSVNSLDYADKDDGIEDDINYNSDSEMNFDIDDVASLDLRDKHADSYSCLASICCNNTFDFLKDNCTDILSQKSLNKNANNASVYLNRRKRKKISRLRSRLKHEEIKLVLLKRLYKCQSVLHRNLQNDSATMSINKFGVNAHNQRSSLSSPIELGASQQRKLKSGVTPGGSTRPQPAHTSNMYGSMARVTSLSHRINSPSFAANVSMPIRSIQHSSLNDISRSSYTTITPVTSSTSRKHSESTLESNAVLLQQIAASSINSTRSSLVCPLIPFLPTASLQQNSHIVCLMGLECAVNSLLDMNTFASESGSVNKRSLTDSDIVNRKVCDQCGIDFTPVWKIERISEKGQQEMSVKTHVSEETSSMSTHRTLCEHCFGVNVKKRLKLEHTNRLKSAFIRALQEEKKQEAVRLMNSSSPMFDKRNTSSPLGALTITTTSSSRSSSNLAGLQSLKQTQHGQSDIGSLNSLTITSVHSHIPDLKNLHNAATLQHQRSTHTGFNQMSTANTISASGVIAGMSKQASNRPHSAHRHTSKQSHNQNYQLPQAHSQHRIAHGSLHAGAQQQRHKQKQHTANAILSSGARGNFYDGKTARNPHNLDQVGAGRMPGHPAGMSSHHNQPKMKSHAPVSSNGTASGSGAASNYGAMMMHLMQQNQHQMPPLTNMFYSQADARSMPGVPSTNSMPSVSMSSAGSSIGGASSKQQQIANQAAVAAAAMYNPLLYSSYQQLFLLAMAQASRQQQEQGIGTSGAASSISHSLSQQADLQQQQRSRQFLLDMLPNKSSGATSGGGGGGSGTLSGYSYPTSTSSSPQYQQHNYHGWKPHKGGPRY